VDERQQADAADSVFGVGEGIVAVTGKEGGCFAFDVFSS
jgi:hypothetical protein